MPATTTGPTTPLAYVYLDGAEVYVHPCEIRSATPQDLTYDPHCIAECETPILAGQTIIVTDAHDQGEATAHLTCLLATSGMVVTAEDAEEMRLDSANHRLHAV